MLPIVTPEELVQPFSFYFEHEIHQGMTYNGRLNILVRTFNERSRDKAYELALRLSHRKLSSIITVSSLARPGCYRVWVDLSAARQVLNVVEDLAA